MGKKILSGIIATALTASTVATSVIPMTNYKPHNENLVANTTDVVETNNVSTLDVRQDSIVLVDRGKINHNNNQAGHIAINVSFKNFPDGDQDGYRYHAKVRLNAGYYFFDDRVGHLNNDDNSYCFDERDAKGCCVSVGSDVKIDDFTNLNNVNGIEEYINQYSGFFVEVSKPTDITFKYIDSWDDYDLRIYELSIVKNDLQKPTISGTNNFVVNVNNMLSKEEILSHISATDDTDGTVPVVIDSTTYNPDNKKIGEYNMIVSASDMAGNKTTVTINIKVVDIDKPVINGTTSYTRSYDNPISIDDIKAGLSVSDNYDSGLQLELIQDNYSSNTNKVGVHTVTFKAKDSSNNESDVCTVSITVEDKTKPVITGPASITVPSNKLFSLGEFKSKYTVNDGLDGTITITDGMISGYDNYLQNSKKIGSYTVTINVADKNGNNATLSVTIKVEDKISPEIWFDDYFIVLEQGQALTPEQIKEYASKALGVSLDAITEVTGEYDTNTAGVYKLSVKTVDGKEHVINLSVTEKAVENIRELKWYEHVYEWFLILFNIEPEYKTDSFWDFGTRWQSVVKVYSEHKILDNNLIK